MRAFIHKIGNKLFQVISIAHNGVQVLEHLKKDVPHIILLDIQMPEMDGISATRIVTKQYPSIRVIALSSFDNLWAVADMVEAGAKGYLLKNASKGCNSLWSPVGWFGHLQQFKYQNRFGDKWMLGIR